MNKNRLKLFVIALFVAIFGSVEISSRFIVAEADEDPLLKEIANYKTWSQVSNNKLSLVFNGSSEFSLAT